MGPYAFKKNFGQAADEEEQEAQKEKHLEKRHRDDAEEERADFFPDTSRRVQL